MGHHKKDQFSFKAFLNLLLDTYKSWLSHDPFRSSAVVAYYAILSLPALLVIIVNIVGAVWGTEIVQGKLTEEFSMALGRDAAASIQAMITETQSEHKSTISTIIGIGVLLFGATGVFYHLKISLNAIWRIKADPNAKIKKVVIDRVLSFAFILAIGFLLLVSFIVTAAISVLNDFIRQVLPDVLLYVAYTLDFLISTGIISVLFGLIFKYLPDANIKWPSVKIGAVLTALLFVMGKSALGYYFGQAEPGSTYGAAGTIVLILLWVSYSCLILFFGAEFTYNYAKKFGYGIEPNSRAVSKEDIC
ncbi:YihY/virulence factor BrkB family protein [Arenibacter sp. F20364]|uniref:YihY/virulence factor BrkB family protein n=1 Tax=Arenibacter sp. F20364 TaxID=2926415 RepID=UPI001FF26FC6|nr:YihY/virulence factor BrkB family protein [Arenibacter sp. F20364]MCK0192073.1 YihY/virulence factor BrkB family protein [Arenibacter sp. F20364]